MLIALIAVLILNILRHQRLLNARYLQYAEVVIIALDQERNRMASDLHDAIGASRTVIKHQLEAVRPDAQEHHSFIGEMIHSVMEVIKQVRAVSLNMMPEVLLKFGLHTALMDMVRQKSFAAKIEISLDYSIGEVSSEAAVHIYHIVQEILNNALKHSKAELI